MLALCTISADRSIALSDIDTGRPRVIFPKAHDSPLQICSYVSPQLLATGDDDGILKVCPTNGIFFSLGVG